MSDEFWFGLLSIVLVVIIALWILAHGIERR